MKRLIGRCLVTVAVLLALIGQETWALAGTTGGLGGVVIDDKNAPVAGASVIVTSASQNASTTTDVAGHFVFLSLAPDTYSVSVEKSGYNPVSYAGVSVFADNQQSLSFRINKVLKEIAKVSSRASGALVKAGTTSDVYSVNAATAAKVTGLGGGGSLDQAYSAIATMPGAYVPVGQNGWFQNVYIRGGDYDQIGYEVDGVPVNRSFDNYPSSTASALGQQEVQVYTGTAPANAEGQGLAGFINQVIKTGSYPGFASSDLGIGGPAYYHKLNVEAGGASPDRLFSYYVGLGGYNQDHHFYDQNNGGSLNQFWGTYTGGGVNQCPATPTPALQSCYDATGTWQPSWQILAPFIIGSAEDFADRETVANFHFALPHHFDGGRDDVQLLYQTSEIYNPETSSLNDYGAPFANAAFGPIAFPHGLQSSIPLGATFNSDAALAAQAGSVTDYGYPSAPAGLGSGGIIPAGHRDGAINGIGVVKLQYQKNFGTSAYLRVYGYSLYSDWLINSPAAVTTGIPSGGYDYELVTHSRGVSATFAKQLTPHNLLNLQASYLTASSLRDNNTQFLNTQSSGYDANMLAVAVSSANPMNGVCYSSGGLAVNCSDRIARRSGNPRPDKVTLAGLSGGSALPGACGGSPCEWLIVGNGQRATYNTVTPRFGAYSLTDEWDPSDRLHINLGVRFDSFQFVPQNTDTGMRNFWFAGWNNTECYDTTNRIAGVKPLATPVTGGTAAVTAACQATFGSSFAQATLSPNSATQTYTEFQPRIGATYTLSPQNVLRASFGKYGQAPNAAFQQYNTLQQNLPSIFAQGTLGGFNLFGFGRNAPTYPIRPEVSYNADLSWEHQFKGSDLSFKLTPFYRKTQDQIEQFYLDLVTGFVSGLNVGTQTTRGVEFQLQKGDFSRNGLSALLSYTYTDAKIRYQNLGGGSSLLDPINASIAQYNGYTKTCATTPTAAGCSYKGSAPKDTAGNTAAPCYTTAGVADATCAAGDIANPYWNDSVKPFIDTNGSYAPYTLFPALPGFGSYGSYVAPHVATLVVNYKHDKLAITPAMQFSSGSKYGYPDATDGVDPAAGCTALASGPILSRNPYSNASGLAYDATCQNGNAYQNASLSIPNPYTGQFDAMGTFTNPSRLTLSTQMSYAVSPRITAVLTLANLWDTCFGGTKAAWTGNAIGIPTNKICSYASGPNGSSGSPPAGNLYNPKGQANYAPIQPIFQYPYQALTGSLPFNAYFDIKIKL